MQEAPNQQQQHDEDSNDFSSTSFLQEFVHRQDTKRARTVPAIIPFSKHLENLSNQLITKLQILTPSKIHSLQLRKQLKNYQFEKHQKKSDSDNLSTFGLKQEDLMKEQNLLIMTLSSLIREFRVSPNKRFFVVSKKNQRVYSFYHQPQQDGQIESYLSISGYGESHCRQLQKQGIPFEKKPHQDLQKIVLKNQAIVIFWGKMLNKILIGDRGFRTFTVIANFPFLNGYESIPIQIFNSTEIKKQFTPIAYQKTDILQQPIYEISRMKIEGYWILQNLKELDINFCQRYGEGKFEVKFTVHPSTKEQASM